MSITRNRAFKQAYNKRRPAPDPGTLASTASERSGKRTTTNSKLQCLGCGEMVHRKSEFIKKDRNAHHGRSSSFARPRQHQWCFLHNTALHSGSDCCVHEAANQQQHTLTATKLRCSDPPNGTRRASTAEPDNTKGSLVIKPNVASL